MQWTRAKLPVVDEPFNAFTGSIFHGLRGLISGAGCLESQTKLTHTCFSPGECWISGPPSPPTDVLQPLSARRAAA